MIARAALADAVALEESARSQRAEKTPARVLESSIVRAKFKSCVDSKLERYLFDN